MTNRAACLKRWSGKRAADESYPLHRGRWPDNDHVAILRRLCPGRVCEVGCGTGRCSDAFSPDTYVGVDINEDAVELARELQPRFMFYRIGWDDLYPISDTYLFHTCMMHLPDVDVVTALHRCKPGRIVIADWMEPRLHKPAGCIFHRSVDWYKQALKAAGFDCITFEEHDTNYQLQASAGITLKRRFMTGQSGEPEGEA